LYKVLPIKLAAWLSWYCALGRVILPVSQNVKGHALVGQKRMTSIPEVSADALWVWLVHVFFDDML